MLHQVVPAIRQGAFMAGSVHNMQVVMVAVGGVGQGITAFLRLACDPPMEGLRTLFDLTVFVERGGTAPSTNTTGADRTSGKCGSAA